MSKDMKGSGLAAEEVEGRGGAKAGGGEAPVPGMGWRRCVGEEELLKTTGGTGNCFAMAAATARVSRSGWGAGRSGVGFWAVRARKRKMGGIGGAQLQDEDSVRPSG
jgi:hypothetical protein